MGGKVFKKKQEKNETYQIPIFEWAERQLGENFL
jgi:hypothetical protein